VCGLRRLLLRAHCCAVRFRRGVLCEKRALPLPAADATPPSLQRVNTWACTPPRPIFAFKIFPQEIVANALAKSTAVRDKELRLQAARFYTIDADFQRKVLALRMEETALKTR
jgi:hypothetical protein